MGRIKREKMKYDYSIKYPTGTGLYYYGARYYDPRTSIWLSTDPLQEKNPNISTYAYCNLNPVNYVDPTGMLAWEPDGDGKLIAQEGDNFSTLKTYLSTIYGGENMIAPDEWNELEQQVNELDANSVGGDIS